MRGGYDGLVVLSCLTRASFPRPLLAQLSLAGLVADLVSSLSVLFLQDAGVRGLAAVHGEAAGGGDTAGGGGGHLLYLGYRLTGARRPGLDTWQQEEEEDTAEEDEDEAEVKQQLEAGGVKERVAALVLVSCQMSALNLTSNNIYFLLQENQKLTDKVLKMERGRQDLEDRVVSLEAMAHKGAYPQMIVINNEYFLISYLI